MPTNAQAEYPIETMIPLTDAVLELVRSGVNITNSILRWRLTHDQVKGRKVQRDWWILKSEVARISEEKQS